VNQSDEALMRKYSEGDLESFHILYSRIAPRWYPIVLDVGRSEEEQKKLFMWLFEEIHKQRGAYESGKNFDKWIVEVIAKSKRPELSLNYGKKLMAPSLKFTELVLDWIDQQILPPTRTVLLRFLALSLTMGLLAELLTRLGLSFYDGRTIWDAGLGPVTEAFARGAVIGLVSFFIPIYFLTKSERLALREIRIWLVPSAVVFFVFLRMIYVFFASGYLSLPLPMTAWAVGLLMSGRLATSFHLR
jgi:hypothetical protein